MPCDFALGLALLVGCGIEAIFSILLDPLLVHGMAFGGALCAMKLGVWYDKCIDLYLIERKNECQYGHGSIFCNRER